MVGVSVNHPFKKNRLDAERRTHLFRVSPTRRMLLGHNQTMKIYMYMHMIIMIRH